MNVKVCPQNFYNTEIIRRTLLRTQPTSLDVQIATYIRVKYMIHHGERIFKKLQMSDKRAIHLALYLVEIAFFFFNLSFIIYLFC